WSPWSYGSRLQRPCNHSYLVAKPLMSRIWGQPRMPTHLVHESLKLDGRWDHPDANALRQPDSQSFWSRQDHVALGNRCHSRRKERHDDSDLPPQRQRSQRTVHRNLLTRQDVHDHVRMLEILIQCQSPRAKRVLGSDDADKLVREERFG